MRVFTTILTLTWMALLAAGCGEERLDPELERLGRAQAPAPEQGATPPGMGMPPPGMGMGMGMGGGEDTGPVHEGEVLETIQVPKYTYLKLKGEGGELTWTAIPSDKIEVGARVSVRQSILMRNFQSRTLNRTFETIVFGTLVGGAAGATRGGADAGAAPQLPAGHPLIDPAPAAADEPAAD